MKKKIICLIIAAALSCFLALPKEITHPLTEKLYCVFQPNDLDCQNLELPQEEN